MIAVGRETHAQGLLVVVGPHRLAIFASLDFTGSSPPGRVTGSLLGAAVLNAYAVRAFEKEFDTVPFKGSPQLSHCPFGAGFF